MSVQNDSMERENILFIKNNKLCVTESKPILQTKMFTYKILNEHNFFKKPCAMK